jgi:hypothetical protein
MWRPRVPLSAGMVVVGIVAIDLAAIRYATAPWESGQPINQPLLNILPMTNALAIAGYRLAHSRGRSRRFATGFLVGGSVALLLHAAYDRAYPQAMWTTCDWLANHCPNPFGGFGNRLMTYAVPGKGSFFRLYPALALVICLPEFVVAWSLGAAARKWSSDSGGDEAKIPPASPQSPSFSPNA